MMLTAETLEVRYDTRAVVRAASLQLAAGELAALIGPNGAGKSTLLRALAGLVPHGGRVAWRGTPVATLGNRARARTIAYLPQDPPVHWPLLAHELVALGRLPHYAYGAAQSEIDTAAVRAALEQTDALGLAERRVDQLSVGERARVLLARALAVEAPVLLVDEPIAMLDPYHQLHVMSTLRTYARGDAHTGPRLVVAVLHDLTLAARFCSRLLLLNEGAIVADGAPDTTLEAARVAEHYRVEALVTRHEGEPVVVPWRPLRR